MSATTKPRINLDLMPESMRVEHCRVLYANIIEHKRNRTPEEQERFERWSEEYDRKHGLIPENTSAEGGET